MADINLILPRELQPAPEVFPTDALVIDNGAAVLRGTPVQIVDAGAPVPSEAVALAGTDNTSRMTPLRVKQVIGDAVIPQVEQAKAWAQSPTAPDPSDPSSKSAKTWANEAKSLYDGLVTYLQTDAQMASLFIPANVPVIQRMPSAQSGGQVAPLNMLSWWRRSTVPTSEPYFTTADGGVWVQTALREQDVLAALQSSISNALFDPAYAGVQPFASLAAFNAAVIPGPVNRVSVIVGLLTGPNVMTVEFVRKTGSAVVGLKQDWVPDGLPTPYHFGAVGNGISDDAEAFQRCASYAGTAITADKAYPLVYTAAYVPPGNYLIGAGKTVTAPRGVKMQGASRSSVRLTHGGGGVPCILLTSAETSNTNVEISDLEIIGAADTTYCIESYGNVRNGLFENVTTRGGQRGVGGDTCYTLVMNHCDIQNASINNIEFGNVTSALFFENRVDQAGVCDVLITGSAAEPNVHVKFIGGHYQRSGQAGIRLVDVDSAEIIAPYFEGNNKDDSGYGDIEWLHGPATRSRTLNVIGAFHTPTTGGATTRQIKASTNGRLTVVGPKSYIGTAPGRYAVGVELGALMMSCDILGGNIDADTRISRASLNTTLRDYSVGEQYSNTGAFLFQSPSNLSFRLDAPSNRRNEIKLSTAGVDKWFLGRGDSDESHPDDFYISPVSGGGNNPDFRIDGGTGDTHIRRLNISGPYLNDGAASLAGVPVGFPYRRTDGVVAWRVA